MAILVDAESRVDAVLSLQAREYRRERARPSPNRRPVARDLAQRARVGERIVRAEGRPRGHGAAALEIPWEESRLRGGADDNLERKGTRGNWRATVLCQLLRLRGS